jgi:hypothetical protein
MLAISLFLIIGTLIIGLIHATIYKVIVVVFAISSPAWLLALRVIFGVLAVSFILALFLVRSSDNAAVQMFYRAAAVWIGFATYLFFAACLYGLAVGVLAMVRPGTNLIWLAIILFAVAIGTGVYGLIHAADLKVKEVTISLPNLPAAWQGKRAVWVSDMHLGAIYGVDFSREVTSAVNALNPDIVWIGGDLYDGVKVDDDAIIAPLAGLKASLGTYFITGNHEEFGDPGPFITAIKKIGIRVLNNESVDIEGVQLIGVDDRDSTDPVKFAAILSGLNIDMSRPSILLKHQPSQLDMAEKAGISLQISGHTHRAQIWPFSLITHWVFHGYDYGLNEWGSMKVLSSSGAGTWGPPMRVGTDAEIVVLTFK